MNAPCIVCKKELDNVDIGGGERNQPFAGTAFISHGHYGSTSFDPMDGSYLEINVCDVCLVRAGAAGAVIKSRDGELVLQEGVVTGMKTVINHPEAPWDPRDEGGVDHYLHMEEVAREQGLLEDGETIL